MDCGSKNSDCDVRRVPKTSRASGCHSVGAMRTIRFSSLAFTRRRHRGDPGEHETTGSSSDIATAFHNVAIRIKCQDPRRSGSYFCFEWSPIGAPLRIKMRTHMSLKLLCNSHAFMALSRKLWSAHGAMLSFTKLGFSSLVAKDAVAPIGIEANPRLSGTKAKS